MASDCEGGDDEVMIVGDGNSGNNMKIVQVNKDVSRQEL